MEKLQEQQREAEVAAQMANFQQMEQEIAAARHDLSQVSDTKAHVEQLFKDGFLFRQEDGSIAMPANDEVRQ